MADFAVRQHLGSRRQLGELFRLRRKFYGMVGRRGLPARFRQALGEYGAEFRQDVLSSERFFVLGDAFNIGAVYPVVA